MKRKKQIRNLIKLYREKKGISQRELAEKVGVSRNTISSIEKGQYSPSAYTAGLICKALEVKFEQLFYIDRCYKCTYHSETKWGEFCTKETDGWEECPDKKIWE